MTWQIGNQNIPSVAGEADFGECGFYLRASGSPDSGPQASPVWAGILHRAKRSVLGLCCQASCSRTATCHWLRAQKQRSELALVRFCKETEPGIERDLYKRRFIIGLSSRGYGG